MKLGIIGLGLIGCSLASAAKAAGYFVIGYDRCKSALDYTKNNNITNSTVHSITEIGQADIIVLAVPMGAYEFVFESLAPILTPQHILSDCGSTKRTVISAADQFLHNKKNRLVPAHPIAGKEIAGFHAMDASLFKNCITVLCPHSADDDAISCIQQLWTDVGAKTTTMSIDEHDSIFAMISHLPHLLAYAMVGTIFKKQNSDFLIRFAAGGFRDFTRIASSDPTMWKDICLQNKDFILDAINQYQKELAALTLDIQTTNETALYQRFQKAQHNRQQWLAQTDL